MAASAEGRRSQAAWPRPVPAPGWAPFPPRVAALLETGPPPPTATAYEIRRLAFYGSGEALFGIHAVNVLLTVLTLGLYALWARVRVQRYLLGHTTFEGDRFAYDGTGEDLFTGWLKAILLFSAPFACLTVGPVWLEMPSAVQTASVLLAAALVTVFAGLATVGSRRYRLARTSWRDIRFSFRGRALAFVKLLLVCWPLTIVTLGLYYPIYATRRQAFLVSHSYLGTQRFDFDGRGGDLVRPFLKALLLTIPTLGLCWWWYAAERQRYFWEHTTVGAARFRYRVGGAALLRLRALNALLLVGTAGIAWPWVKVRNLEFTFRNLALDGPLDTAAIVQEDDDVSTTTAGVIGLFEIGFDFG